MSRFIRTRFVLAVHDVKRSTEYYRDVLDFELEPIEAEGWSFLRRGDVHMMLGECPDAIPPRELGDHQYFAYMEVDDIDAYHALVTGNGADLSSALADKPWGMREFGVRTVDGHRILFGQDI